jgi:hypothetical protein
VVIVAVNRVLSGSGAGVVGVNVAVLAPTAYVTLPATAVPPSVVFTTVKVVLPIVAGFIASLKVAVILVLVKTPVAALPGIVEATRGLVVSGTAPVVPVVPGNQCPVLPPSPHPAMTKPLRRTINKQYVCRDGNLFFITVPPFLLQ